VAGRLQRITLKAGDTVKQGSVVARMNPLPLDPRAHAEATARLEAAQAAKREAQARVEQAGAALEQARREAERARKLERGGTISQGERERADLELTTREKELEAALFAARAADYNVQAAQAALLTGGPDASRDGGSSAVLELHSPVDGFVLRLLEESERTVAFGTPLLEIADPASLEIVVDVLTTDAVKVRPGATLLVDDWGGEEELEARVRLVEPSAFTKVSALGVEEQRVNVVADFAQPQPRLGDGYRLEAHIVVWEGDGVLKVPNSALFRHRGEWCVFVVEDGRARRRTVRIGAGNPVEYQVLDGLAEGEHVIVHPSDLVDEGKRVQG
jgi:HlyD family secretion protein